MIKTNVRFSGHWNIKHCMHIITSSIRFFFNYENVCFLSPFASFGNDKSPTILLWNSPVAFRTVPDLQNHKSYLFFFLLVCHVFC